jgi:hypothetical protein
MLAAGDRSPMKPAKFDSITACGTVCLLVLAILPTASAIPLEYTVSSLTLPASGSDTVIVNPGATAPLTFTLNAGLSNDFVFFTLSQTHFPSAAIASGRFPPPSISRTRQYLHLRSTDLLMREALIRLSVLTNPCSRSTFQAIAALQLSF